MTEQCLRTKTEIESQQAEEGETAGNMKMAEIETERQTETRVAVLRPNTGGTAETEEEETVGIVAVT